ncbi:MAG: hypothetical protein HY289_07455 [Planctomycetes bacterium]|nr:hypothetical protein [Planctomycetota bacterium]
MTGVLCWPKKLLSADDLRRHLTSQGELLLLPRTIITPLAADELKAKGVRVRFETAKAQETISAKGAWFVAQEKSDALIAAAVKSVERDGIVLTGLEFTTARKIAEALVAKKAGVVVFCSDPATVCCIANKIAGVRAAAVGNMMQTSKAKKNLGANLFAIEMPGPTFFELRQMLRTIVAIVPSCSECVAKTLQELDGHAHR